MPSFRTIAYLKKNNAEAFRKVFRQFVLMLKDMGLIEGETIGIDSFKIFAQNSLRNNYTQKKIDRHLEYIDNRIEEFEVALQAPNSIWLITLAVEFENFSAYS